MEITTGNSTRVKPLLEFLGIEIIIEELIGIVKITQINDLNLGKGGKVFRI